jgi:hypothetical protein
MSFEIQPRKEKTPELQWRGPVFGKSSNVEMRNIWA